MPSGAEMKAAVDSAIQEITEGQAALRAAEEEANRLLGLAINQYEEAVSRFAAISDKLDEASGILRDAVDNEIGVLQPQITNHVDNAVRNGMAAGDLASVYRDML